MSTRLKISSLAPFMRLVVSIALVFPMLVGCVAINSPIPSHGFTVLKSADGDPDVVVRQITKAGEAAGFVTVQNDAIGKVFDRGSLMEGILKLWMTSESENVTAEISYQTKTDNFLIIVRERIYGADFSVNALRAVERFRAQLRIVFPNSLHE